MNVYEATVREFIFQDGVSNKFWRYWIFEKESIWYAQWGKVGATGQAKGFRCVSGHHARVDARDKAHEKQRKGYQGGPVIEVDVRSIHHVHELTATNLDSAWLRRAKRDASTPTREEEDVQRAVKDLLNLDKMLGKL